MWWLSIFVVFFCRAASGNPLSREHTPRQKWAETRAVSWLHTAYSVALNLLRIKDPRDGRWQMTKQAFPIQERLGKEPGLGLLFGRVRSRWCYDEAISIGFSRIRKHVFIFTLYSVLRSIYSVLHVHTPYCILTLGQKKKKKNIRKSVIKPRKNSPFRTHPLRTRIILALIGCCSDHGSRRGQLAGHRAL